MLREVAPSWRFYPVILALQAMRGVQFTVALGLVAEIGDLSRFDSPRELMGWLGIVPSEYSSGARRSEEHTSELQSLMRISYAVFCLKKTTHKINTRHKITRQH